MPNILTDIKTEQIGADLSKVVDRISKQYDRSDTAFQKEAIQNAWDIREDRKEGRGWDLKIYEYTDENSKTHVVVEDFGTKGMNKDRWEGFSSLWKPKKDRDDAGGKGQGKFVLMNASSNHILFVESISDSGYICRFLQDGKKSSSSENLDISVWVKGVEPLDHKGTKIWVYDVQEKFLKALHSDEFTESIMESWWQVLGPRFNKKINSFGKEIAHKPLQSPLEEITLCENLRIGNFGRIKRLHIAFYTDRVISAFDGVMVQRANMMIVKIPFEVYDKEYQGRFSGSIEFDEDLEDSLKDIEKNDHCNFLYESPWKEIKGLIKDEANKFVSRIVPTKEQRKVMNVKNLSEVIQKANQIIDEYCPEILGIGTVVPPIIPKPKPPIRIKHLSVNKREVKWGDTLKANCGILNTTNEEKKISLRVEIKRQGTRVIEEEYSIKIKSSELRPMKLMEIELNQDEFSKGKHILRATLSAERHDLDTKSTSFYLETKREPVKRGFIKGVKLVDIDEPIRNTPVSNGILSINLMHTDFQNLWDGFNGKPSIQNRQIGYYIMKLILDEAVRYLLRIRLDANAGLDSENTIQEVKEIQDRMYYDVYA